MKTQKRLDDSMPRIFNKVANEILKNQNAHNLKQLRLAD